jgi:uncharacterized protein
MLIDWTNFSPCSALAGGALIGLAAGAFVLLLGRIAGVSGLIAGLIPPRRRDASWRLAFLLGLFVAPAVAGSFGLWSPPRLDASYALLAFGGLLVGFGSRLGSGCTSGHGVCGLSRLLPRSFTATCVFLFSGVAAVFVLRHFAV